MLRGQRRPGDRWTEHDTSTAVALTLYEDSLCTGCGQPLGESTSSDADPANRDGAFWYEVPPPVECHACVAIAKTTEGYKDASEHRRGAMRFYAVKSTDETDQSDVEAEGVSG